MSTLVPIEAKGGMMLHPGPGPFAAGPGPFPPLKSLPSSCCCPSPFAANVTAEENITATAVTAMSIVLARLDNLFTLAPLFPR
jgi:hypothetical protein